MTRREQKSKRRRKEEPFFSSGEQELRREKEKARDLRRTQWWKRRLAKGECHWCGKKFAPAELTMDHVVPISRGGRSVKGNVVPSCKACNTAKKHRLPWEARKEEG
ncbi:MAG: HNH endonuclease [Deltaproteobacteria bacterium]|nr:HNH endonuclease [Deltaproteobacteria bacterium]